MTVLSQQARRPHMLARSNIITPEKSAAASAPRMLLTASVATGEKVQGIAQFLDVNPQLVSFHGTQLGKDRLLFHHPPVVMFQQWGGKDQIGSASRPRC